MQLYAPRRKPVIALVLSLLLFIFGLVYGGGMTMLFILFSIWGISRASVLFQYPVIEIVDNVYKEMGRFRLCKEFSLDDIDKIEITMSGNEITKFTMYADENELAVIRGSYFKYVDFEKFVGELKERLCKEKGIPYSEREGAAFS